MRLALIATVLVLFNQFAIANETLKVVDDFYKESESLQKNAKSSSGNQQRLSYLKNFEQSLKSSLDQYEKKDPKLGGSAEEKISVLYYTLEPVFKLSNQKKVTSEDCSHIRQEIKTGDSMGRDEEAPASKPALTAYEWLDLICPTNSKEE